MSNSNKFFPLEGKEPWLAVNLSLLLPGLGQFYSGKIIKGIIFLLVPLIVILICFFTFALTLAKFTSVVAICLSLVTPVIIVGLFDAYYSAKTKNSNIFNQERKKHKDAWLAVFLSQLLPGVGHIYIKKYITGIILIIVSIIVSGFRIFLVPFVAYNVYMNAPIRREKNKGLITKFSFGIVFYYLFVILIFALFVVTTKVFIVESRNIPSISMAPTLITDDKVVINKLNYTSPNRGDVIVFNPTEALIQKDYKDAFISRIIGLPGDTVEIKEGKVYVNQQPLKEEYINEPPNYVYGPEIVPKNSYFVLGDNRNNSYDSHYWGFVPKNNIIGRATKIFSPLNREKPIK